VDIDLYFEYLFHARPARKSSNPYPLAEKRRQKSEMTTARKSPTTAGASRSTTRGDRIENREGAVRIARKDVSK
jgi:hypothetical protein